MLQVIFSLLIVVGYNWFPAWLHILYAVFGIYSTVAYSYFKGCPKRIHKIIFLASVFICLSKVLILAEISFGDYLGLQKFSEWLIKVFMLSTEKPFPNNMDCVIPDLTIIVICIIFSRRKLRNLSSEANRIVKSPIILILLWASCCYNFELFGVGYNIIAIIWVVLKVYFAYQNCIKFTSLLLSLLSFFEIIAKVVYNTEPSLKVYNLNFFGLYPANYIELAIIVSRFILSTGGYQNQVSNSKKTGELDEPFIETNQVRLRDKIIELIAFFLLKIGLFIWVEFNPGITGIFIIAWFGNVLITKDLDYVIGLSKYILLPIILVSYVYNYYFFLLSSETSWVHYSILLTVMLLANLSSCKPILLKTDKLFPDNWCVSLMFSFVSRIYIVSTIALFITGLAKINLLHAGLMILNFFYLSNLSRVQKHWSWVIIYLVFLLLLRELWNSLKLLVPYSEENEYILKFIGLNSNKQSQEFRTIDGVYWVMLFFCSIQQYSNEYTRNRSRRYSHVMTLLLKLYKYLIRSEIWLIYTGFILISFFREANLLNYFRCFLILIVITKHIGSPYTSSSKNFLSLGPYLSILMIYCMFVLCIRYTYQFLNYFNEFPVFDKIGLEVYENITNLYYTIATDTILVLLVLLARRCNEQWILFSHKGVFDIMNINLNNPNKDIGKRVVQNSVLNVFSFITKNFNCIVFVIIGGLAIFWKLSISMFIYVFLIVIYQIRLSLRIYFKNSEFKKDLTKPDIQTALWDDEIIKGLKEKVRESSKKMDHFEWVSRAQLWRILYTWTFICINLSYLRYFCLIDVGKWDTKMETLFFAFGYSASQKLILIEACGYFIIFICLAIEGILLHEFKPEEIQELNKNELIIFKNEEISFEKSQGNKKKVEFSGNLLKVLFQPMKFFILYQRHQKIQGKIKKYMLINFIKLLIQILFISSVIWLSVYKLSFISIVYSVLICIWLFINSNVKFILLSTILFISIIIQYFMCLTNLSTEVTPEYLPRNVYQTMNEFNIPWIQIGGIQTFSKLSLFGNTHEQFNLLFIEFLISIWLLIYWKYLSSARDIAEYYKKIQPDIESIASFKSISLCKVKQDTSETLSILTSIEYFIYKFGRISTILIVLLFAVQSKGVFSIIYCLFCFFFLYNENLIVLRVHGANKTEKNNLASQSGLKVDLQNDKNLDEFGKDDHEESREVKKVINIFGNLNNRQVETNSKDTGKSYVLNEFKNYLTQLNYFIIFISINIFLQIELSIIIAYFSENLKNQWPDLFELLELQNQSITIFQEIRNDLLLKASSLCILFLLKSIMKSKNFSNIQEKVSENIQKQSESIFYKLTYLFHRNIKKTDKNYSNLKKGFETTVDKLFVLSNHYNESIMSLIKPQIHENISDIQEITFSKEKDVKTSYLIADKLIKGTNPFLFEKFMRKLVLPGSMLPDKKRFESRQSKFQNEKNAFFGIKKKAQDLPLVEDFEPRESEIQDSKIQVFGVSTEYEVSWRNYPELICYFLASNTEFIVYISFLVNHLEYVSIESLVFPLAVFGYAMLEFPRPKMKFFRYMLVYTFFVLFVKYFFQLNILQKLDWVKEYKDPYRIGFRPVKDEEFFNYVLWDVVILFTILCREYYMIRIGMWSKSEVDSGALEGAVKYLNIKKITESHRPDGFFYRLMAKDPSFKPGVDLYLYTFLMQLLIFIYLVIFFNKIDGMNEDISKAIIASKFDGKMIIALLTVLSFIIFDRYVYLQDTSIALKEALKSDDNTNLSRSKTLNTFTRSISLLNNKNNSKSISKFTQKNPEKNMTKKMQKYNDRIFKLLVIKLVFHWLILIIVHFIIFWYFPYENEQDNGYLKLLYALFIIYMTFQSQQFRLGHPSFSETSFPLMRHTKSWSYKLFKFYRALPFLYELRTVIDWTFTKTSLNLYQWIKFEEIQIQLFLNDCTQKALKYKKHGEKIKSFEKCQYGICSFCLMIIIIFLPLIIFSTLNPFSITNHIIGASLNVKVVIDDRSFKLYSVSSADNLVQVDKELYEKEGFDTSEELNKDDFNRMQQIRMPHGPDYNWDITPIAKEKMKSLLKKVMENEEISFKIECESIIKRKYPEKYQSVTLITEKSMNLTHANKLYNILFNSSNEALILENMTYTIFRLPSAGSYIEAIPYTKDNFFSDIQLELINYQVGSYWQVLSKKVENTSIGPIFYVISDEYYVGTFDYSVITFYISIVYLAGKVLRIFLVGYGLNIVMTDMKNCENLRTLCSAVFINRMNGNWNEEERLYFELIDILRSPELTKILTKSSRIKNKRD